MGFTEIEATGKKALEQFPVLKRSAKRVYQLVSVTTSKEKLKAEGDITCVSPDDGYEYFYGYYDKSPWDATDRYMICVRVQQTYKSVSPKESGLVCLIDTADNNKLIKIGVTHAWNVQQSCMAQWMGPDFKTRIIYNDYRDGHYCSVVFNVDVMKEEKQLPLAVYDVSRDGSCALSLDFNRLHRMRPGYGYSNQLDSTKGELCPDKTCIWKMDIESGKVENLFKYTDFAAFDPDETMKGAEHKVNHIMISPNGKRFMVLHRWFNKGRKHTRLVTVNMDKTDMYNLSDDVFVSHCFWKNDKEILSFLRKKETGDHYYLMKDKTKEYRMLWPELNTDGHCSYSPGGQFIITDTYPNRKRIASVYLCTEEDDRSRKVARVFSPFKYDNNCRCDLHPRWNREGNKICIDSVHDGKRGLYVVALNKYIDTIQFPHKTEKKNCTLLTFVIPAYNAEATILRCIDSLIGQTDSHWEAIVIDDGSTDRTLKILEKYKECKNIKIVTQKNAGPGVARNNGISIARGTFISFLDSDDYLDSSFVQRIRERIDNTDADVVFYETVYETEEGKAIKTSKIFNYADNNKRDFIVRQLAGTFSWGATKVIKKELIDISEAKFTGQDVGEESIFTFAVLVNAKRIEFVKYPLYHYIQSDQGQHKKGYIDPLSNACKMMKDYMISHHFISEYQPALNCMAYKAVSQSLYRCALNFSYHMAKNKMKEILETYNAEYDLKALEVDKLSRSAKLLYPFVKTKMVYPIYVAARIRSKSNIF